MEGLDEAVKNSMLEKQRKLEELLEAERAKFKEVQVQVSEEVSAVDEKINQDYTAEEKSFVENTFNLKHVRILIFSVCLG